VGEIERVSERESERERDILLGRGHKLDSVSPVKGYTKMGKQIHEGKRLTALLDDCAGR
jgi:hypothetical protein